MRCRDSPRIPQGLVVSPGFTTSSALYVFSCPPVTAGCLSDPPPDAKVELAASSPEPPLGRYCFTDRKVGPPLPEGLRAQRECLRCQMEPFNDFEIASCSEDATVSAPFPRGVGLGWRDDRMESDAALTLLTSPCLTR